MVTAGTYPARVDARLEPQLSRWLWLVKYPPFRLDMGGREPAIGHEPPA